MNLFLILFIKQISEILLITRDKFSSKNINVVIEMDEFEEFKIKRKEMNEKIFNLQNKQINRFYALDTGAYQEGALPVNFKELLGLSTSLVLRCEDCIKYHMIRAVQEGCSDDEIAETLTVALIVGGSIVIPEMRRAVDTLYQLRAKLNNGESLYDLL